MKIRKFGLLLATLLFSSLASAEGWFYSASIGQGRWKEAGEYDRQIGAAVDCSPVCDSQSYKTKDTSLAYKIGAGYRFNKFLAAEITYNNMGKYKSQINQDYTTALGYSNSIAESHEITGFNYSAIFYLPVTGSVDLFGKLGVANLKVYEKWSGSCSNGSSSCLLSGSGFDSVNNWKPSFGVGAAYKLNPSLALTVEWERMTGKGQIFQRSFQQDFTVDLITSGLRYDFF